jgi:hypothetical protein
LALQVIGSDGRPKLVATCRGGSKENEDNFQWMVGPLESLMRSGAVVVGTLLVDFAESAAMLGHKASGGLNCMYYMQNPIKADLNNGPVPLTEKFYATVGEVREALRAHPELAGVLGLGA